MEKLPELGKIHPDFFNRVIYTRLGKKDKSIQQPYKVTLSICMVVGKSKDGG